MKTHNLARIIILSTIFIPVLLVASIVPTASAQTPHSPILIDGDNQFTPANGVARGTGTSPDPYVIEGFDVTSSTANGIEVRNTTAHFIIRNLNVHSGSTSFNDGIQLYNVTNGGIENVTSDNNQRGITILQSDAVEIIGNMITANTGYGILLDGSVNVFIAHNNLINNNIASGLRQGLDNRGSQYNNWDDGWLGGGNYWSDYTGIDQHSGPNQNQPGPDGLGDTVYTVNGSDSTDNYPLISPYTQTTDTTPPIWPSGSSLTFSNLNPTNLTLSWTPANDNARIDRYQVYHSNNPLAVVAGTILNYNVTGLTPGASYTFRVEASDPARNWSSNGPTLTVVTPGSEPAFWIKYWYLFLAAGVATVASSILVFQMKKKNRNETSS